jgi:hypothetical protein
MAWITWPLGRQKLAKTSVHPNIGGSQTRSGDFGVKNPGITVFAMQTARNMAAMRPIEAAVRGSRIV